MFRSFDKSANRFRLGDRRSPARSKVSFSGAETLEPRMMLAGDLRISEFMASNGGVVEDEDGDAEDWIEIYNPTDLAIDLTGWTLTDDDANLSKWTFPSQLIAAGEHLLVFASGKDRAIAGLQLHTNFSLAEAGEYLALVEPGGTAVSHEFAPQYPPQIRNVSYGYEQHATTLVEPTALSGAAGAGGRVILQNATATYSQGGLEVFKAIDSFWDRNRIAEQHGWAIDSTGSQTAVFETADNVGFAGGTELTFMLMSGGYDQVSHTLGRFRISVTTDDRSTFADGLTNGGDVTANWTVLDPSLFVSDNGGVAGNNTTLTKLPDGSILASGPQILNAVETYTVRATTPLTGITGVRLEALTDPSLPLGFGGFNGPGRSTTSANFVLRDFAMFADSVVAKTPLQNATAVFSQTGLEVDKAIDGLFDTLMNAAAGGWGNLTNGPNTAVFETVSNIGFAGGTDLTFNIASGGYGQGSHTLGRFRLSVTTDDRSTFADGLASGGDVTANWTVLEPTSFVSDNGRYSGTSTTLTKLPDNSLLASGAQAASVVETYTVRATTNLTGITGIRLEAMVDPSLPLNSGGFNGPGRSTTSGNFVLRELTLSAAEPADGILGPKLLVPDASDAALATTWTEIGFTPDADWLDVANGVGFVAGSLAQSATAYGNLTGAPGSQIGTELVALGHDFDVAAPIEITSLGVFDSGANGLSNTITAELWSRTNTAAPLAQLVFSPGSPGTLVGSDRFKPLAAPMLLSPGAYSIVAYGYGTGEPNGNEGIVGGPYEDHKTLDDGAGAIKFVGSSRYGTAGAFPTVVDNGPANRYSGPTFQYNYHPLAGQFASNVQTAMHGQNASAYLRIEFEAGDLSSADRLALEMKYDDGFVAYLNGVEVARRNAPETLAWNSAAAASHPDDDGRIYESIPISDFLDELVVGTNVLAIHALNASAADDDFLIVARLVAIDPLAALPRYLEPSTPGGTNSSATIYDGYVADTSFSLDRGFYTTPQIVSITTETFEASIYYTTDGSAPSPENGTLYTAPIPISTTTSLRAIAVKDGFKPTNVDTQTYIFAADVLSQTSLPAGYPATWNGTTSDYTVSQNPADLARIAGNPLFTPPEYTAAIVDSLLDLPTLAITIDVDDLFGAKSGIYSHPTLDGPGWERPASIEYILPDGSEGFQIDAGLRIMGFTSRNPALTAKHSLRILFKEEYGDGRLNYPFFADSPVDSINTIALRANTRDTWAAFDPGRAGPFSTYMRDQWSKEAQAAMGRPATAGNFVHLYINGLYWGVYNPTERPDAAWAEEKFGGSTDDYDVIKFCCAPEVVDGNFTKWNELLTLARAGLSTDAAYQRLLGNNPDGTRNESFDVLIDIDNFIDYIIHGEYTGAEDWPGNYYVIRRRGPDSEGFQFFAWDNDLTFPRGDVNKDKTFNDSPGGWWANSPGEIELALRANAEYRVRFADRVQKHFFHDGSLTPERAAQLWASVGAEVQPGLIAESLRWGDATGPLYTVTDDWLEAYESMLANFFPQRTQVVLNQLNSRGLLPDVSAPEFQIGATPQHGGVISAGSQLSIVAPPTTPFFENTSLIGPEAPASVIVPTDGALDSNNRLIPPGWTATGFAESGWNTGQTIGVGFDTTTLYDALIRTDLQAEMYLQRTGVYIRVPFSHDGTSYDKLTLRMKYDDGFVAYLNGVEVAAANAPAGALAFDSLSNGEQDDLLATVYQDFDLTPFKNLLNIGGNNVLAIHGLNRSLDSTDMLILPELVGGSAAPIGAGTTYYTLDGSDPRLTGGAVDPLANVYSTPIALGESTLVKSRTIVGGSWSPLSEALFTVESPLRVTEVMYNPAGSDDAEFIELWNTGSETIDLVGIKISGLGDYEFLATDVKQTLAPGEYIVIAQDLAAFAAAYPNAPAGILADRAFGPSNLDNGGETITVFDAAGGMIQSFRYEDRTSEGWYDETDGGGYSLVPIDLEGNYNSPANWRASGLSGGSPGQADPLPIAADVNGDGTVNRRDLVRLLGSFGRLTGADRAAGDVSGDGGVSLVDLALMQSSYGQTVVLPSPAPLAVAAPTREESRSGENRIARLDAAQLHATRRRALVDRPEWAAADQLYAGDQLNVERKRRSIARRPISALAAEGYFAQLAARRDELAGRLL